MDNTFTERISESELYQRRKDKLIKKLQSYEDSKVSSSTGVFSIAILIIFGLCSLFYYLLPNLKILGEFTTIIFIVGFALASGLLLTINRIRAFFTKRQIEDIDWKLVKLSKEQLQLKLNEDFFTNLVGINFKHLDEYYYQTQHQARKSFNVSIFASVTSFIIIVIGIFMMYQDKSTSAYITTGTGVLSEFIAAIFFYLYNRTILKMSEYHQKLVVTQNINLSLKMTEEMEGEDKAKAQALIIDRLTQDINKHLSQKQS
ncbi:TRADD-N-associated membrane domain-containing protein [Algivirga pacifica]|uniref:Cyanobacterial TRADD-N associated 2 transmembrane domain-containing protein n=1 Tax=Algivirga pacifica TaxID=1162670 RepID=A0ABP9DLB2_9BACT